MGAIVPDVLLETPLPSRTNDADVVILVESLDAFGSVTSALLARDFRPVGTDGHRFAYKTGGLIDILPYSEQLAPDGTLQLNETRILNMAGFEQAVSAAQDREIESGFTVPLVPLALYAILKLVAYTDRKYQKDIEGVEHVLRHYGPDDERRWGLTAGETVVEYDFGPAYLLGLDGRKFLTSSVTKTIHPLLERLAVDERAADEASGKPRRHELFNWYRRGLFE